MVSQLPCSHLPGTGSEQLCEGRPDSILHLDVVMSAVPHFLPKDQLGSLHKHLGHSGVNPSLALLANGRQELLPFMAWPR